MHRVAPRMEFALVINRRRVPQSRSDGGEDNAGRRVHHETGRIPYDDAAILTKRDDQIETWGSAEAGGNGRVWITRMRRSDEVPRSIGRPRIDGRVENAP